jgi:hypothetical protein
VLFACASRSTRRRLRRFCFTLAAVAAAAACAAPPSSAAPVSVRNLACLGPDALQAVKTDPSPRFGALFDSCVGELREDLGPNFDDLGDDALRYVLATVVAFDSASYGAFGRYDLPSLTRARQLDCASYVALTWQLARVSGASVRYAHPIGWDGGTVGNHAQLAYERPGQELLLDPTIGLVVRASLSSVMDGASVPGENMVVFPKGTGAMRTFRDMVTSSLYQGSFNRANSIYVQLYPPGDGADYAEAISHPDTVSPAPDPQPAPAIVPAPTAPATGPRRGTGSLNQAPHRRPVARSPRRGRWKRRQQARELYQLVDRPRRQITMRRR